MTDEDARIAHLESMVAEMVDIVDRCLGAQPVRTVWGQWVARARGDKGVGESKGGGSDG